MTPKRPTLDEHRTLLNDLHREISNRPGDPDAQLFKEAYETLLWLTLEYLTPDFDPPVVITVKSG